MQAIYPEHGRAAVAFTTLASLAAVALLGAVLAYWTWVWFAPAPEPRAAAPEQAAGATVPTPGAAALFGRSQGGSTAAAPPSGALRLLGVVAATGGLAAYAVIRTEGGQSIAVRAGDDVSRGVRLAEVHSDRVVLTRGMVRETLVLPEPGTAARPATPAIAK